ncbi:hypothetical protein WDW37_10340 [Bdellovibrionota bacterium FG-1]
MTKTLCIVGFGSQAQAWTRCLLDEGETQVQVYLARQNGPSFQAAQELGIAARSVQNLGPDLLALQTQNPTEPALVALLCPDSVIGSVYHEVLAPLSLPLTIVLAHGYAIYAGDLKPSRPEHQIALFAPKAIGPKIWALFQQAKAESSPTKTSFHRLVAGFYASAERAPQVRELARLLRFAPERLVPASFEKEAIGDLLSEQGLLCGGVFTLLEWTIEAMTRAEIPAGLIREECLTELELIAGLLRERGPAATFGAISQAAQCGAVAMRARLEASGVRAHFDAQLSEVLDRRFIERFRGETWKAQADAFQQKLLELEKNLSGDPLK